MKNKSFLLFVACIFTGLAALGFSPKGDNWQVSDMGPNHRQWSRVTTTTNATGDTVVKTNKIVELATGMNRQVNGQYVASNPHIIPTTNGALCAGAGHQVLLAPNLNTRAAVQIRTPQANWIQGNIVGLVYYDPATNKSVLIAQVQDSYGVIVDDNHVIYRNAFNGLNADVRYSYTKKGIEQDVILRQQPPAPEVFGLSSETAQLIVMTEFVNTPAPTNSVYDSSDTLLAAHRLASLPIRNAAGITNSFQGTNTDHVMDFADMKLSFGKAFQVGGTNSSPVLGNSVKVRRRWQVQNGRSFLIEQVKLKEVRKQLNNLPEFSRAEKLELQGLRNRVLDHLPLPESLVARNESKPMSLATKSLSESLGFVLDYDIVVGYGDAYHYQGFVFEPDTTYVIVGPCVMSGTTAFYPGAVIKYEIFTSPDGGDASITTLGPTVFYQDSSKVYFTSTEDITVGDTAPNTTGVAIGVSPNGSGSYNDVNIPAMALYKNALVMYGYAEIYNVEVRYAGVGISFLGNGTQSYYNYIYNSAFVDCGYAVSIDNTTVNADVENTIFYTSDSTAQWLWPEESICTNWQNNLFDTTPFHVPDGYSCWVYGNSLTFDMCQSSGFNASYQPGYCDNGNSSFNFRTWNGGNYYNILGDGVNPDFCTNFWTASSLVTPSTPNILVQPLSQAAGFGQNVNFSVFAGGTRAMNYQWYKGGVSLTSGGNVSGSANSTLTVSNISGYDAGNFYVIASNSVGSVTSSVAVLTVYDPLITTQPIDQIAYPGSQVTFSVVATGTAPLSYQWRFNGTNIANATNTSLTLNRVQTNQVGNYSVSVSNCFGTTISSNATLIAKIVVAPSGLIAWWRGEGNGLDSAGSYNGTLTNGVAFANGEVGQAFSFSGGKDWEGHAAVRIPYSSSLINTNATIETWIKPASQVTNSASQSVIFGEAYGYLQLVVQPGTTGVKAVMGLMPDHTYSLTVTSTNDIPIGQFTHLAGTWDGAVMKLYINGVLNNQSTIGAQPVASGCPFYIGGFYSPGSDSCNTLSQYFNGLVDEVSYYNRALSQAEILSVYNAGQGGKCLAPVITNQPIDQVVNLGQPASFSVSACGVHPLSYQWMFNGTNIVNATNDTFVLSSVQLSQFGYYSVLVTNAYGSNLSATAVLNNGDELDASGAHTLMYDFQHSIDPNVIISVRLGYWNMDTTNWIGDGGQLTLVASNVALISSWKTNAILIDNTNAATISYRDVETNGCANIYLRNGTIRFWFKPDWNSVDQGGVGPQTDGRLIEIGSKGSTNGWWGLSVDSLGENIYFGTQTNSITTLTTNLSVQITWVSNVWHQIALTYSPSNSMLYLDGQQVITNGLPVSYYPRMAVRGLGFSIGSAIAGTNQSAGVLDELETFNYPVDAATIMTNYNTGISLDSDGDGISDIIENQNGSNPYLYNSANGLDSTNNLQVFTPLR